MNVAMSDFSYNTSKHINCPPVKKETKAYITKALFAANKMVLEKTGVCA